MKTQFELQKYGLIAMPSYLKKKVSTGLFLPYRPLVQN